MVDLDEIAVDLRAVGTGLDRAGEALAAAQRLAEQIAGHAARSGFTGIASGMTTVREVIIEVRGRLAGITSDTTRAATAVRAAALAPTPRQAAGALSQAARATAGVGTGVAATIGRLDDAGRLVEGVLRGGQPGPMLTALRTVVEILALVYRHGVHAGEQARAVITAAGRVGDPGKRPGLAVTNRPAPSQPAVWVPWSVCRLSVARASSGRPSSRGWVPRRSRRESRRTGPGTPRPVGVVWCTGIRSTSAARSGSCRATRRGRGRTR